MGGSEMMWEQRKRAEMLGDWWGWVQLLGMGAGEVLG
jgi:hypothetical protein